MPMKKWKIFLVLAAIILMVPVELMASSVWSGKDVYKEDLTGTQWGVKAQDIAKINDPGEVYSIDDMESYSAYMTNDADDMGKTIDQAFFWYNKSRLAYAKLINVEGISKVSFVFQKELYLFCAQFDQNFRVTDLGLWMTTGDVCQILPETKWIVVVFRKVNGDLSIGSGIDIAISSSDIKASAYRYLVFKPFTYTFNLNGGQYGGSTGTYTAERLGVEKMTLPVPTRKGFKFAGWKSNSGQMYSGTLSAEYKSELFQNMKFDAVWTEIMPSSVKLDSDYVVLEQNSSDAKKLTAQVGPSEAFNKTVTWSSSDERVAKVDANGNISAGSSGTAVITAATANGIKAQCTVYVMGFQVSVPAYCTLNQSYEIRIDVYNNGSAEMTGRKRVIVDADNAAVVCRKGDEKTEYNVLAECAGSYNGQYKRLNSGEYLADTMESTTVYYRLKPEKEITRAGDYTGNVNFSVMVR